MVIPILLYHSFYDTHHTRYSMKTSTKARIFLLVDLREFFSDLGSGGRKKIDKKALKMTS